MVNLSYNSNTGMWELYRQSFTWDAEAMEYRVDDDVEEFGDYLEAARRARAEGLCYV